MREANVTYGDRTRTPLKSNRSSVGRVSPKSKSVASELGLQNGYVLDFDEYWDKGGAFFAVISLGS